MTSHESIMGNAVMVSANWKHYTYTQTHIIYIDKLKKMWDQHKTHSHRCIKTQHTHTNTHTSDRCCGLLTLISAALARTLSSVSTTSVSLGDDQQRRQECLRREEKEHSFFHSAFLPLFPPSHDPSIFSCCTAGSSIAALASCRYTAEKAEPQCACVSMAIDAWSQNAPMWEWKARGGWVRVKAVE